MSDLQPQKIHHLIGSNQSWMDYRRYCRRCWIIRTGHLKLMLVRRYLGMEVPRKEKGKVTRHSCQRIVMPLVLQIQTSDTESKSVEDDPMKLQLSGPMMTISFPDGTKDAKAISLIVPPPLIVNSDSRSRNEINRHEDPDGTRVLLLLLQTLAQEDRKIHLSVEDVTCVDDPIVTPFFIGMIALHHSHLEIRHHLRQYQTDLWNQPYLER